MTPNLQRTTYLESAVRWLLLFAVFSPLIVYNATIHPYVFSKTIFYRVLIEAALILGLASFIHAKSAFSFAKLKLLLKNPVIIFLTLFLISLSISALLADNSYRAFWGDLERGVGVFGFLHFYLFLILALAFFTEKNWDLFLKLTVAVGLLVLGLAYAEYWGLDSLTIARKERPESFLGNPAFLSTHLIFLITFSTILAIKRWYPAVLVLALSIPAVFLTGTRSAILGLGAGFVALLLYFAVLSTSRHFESFGLAQDKLREESSANPRSSKRGPSRLLRMISGLLLVLLIIFSGVFWVTRTNDFWQNIPGLDRLARTAVADINDGSTQFRLMTWRLSWEAFKERPVFGWGQENFIVAYQKHFDPRYGLLGDTWLDSAHSKFFDVLIAQGLLGVFAYFGLVGSLLYVILKKIGAREEYFYAGGVLFAGTIAYAVQNLALFDYMLSYATFFALVAYILSIELGPTEKATVLGSKSHVLGSLLVMALAAYSVFTWNIIPLRQGVAFQRSSGAGSSAGEVEAAIKRATTPYNFAQYDIRGRGIDTVYRGQYFGNLEYVSNPNFRSLGNTLIGLIEELLEREPYDIRNHIRLSQMLTDFGTGMTEEEIKKNRIYERAEEIMRDAVELAPRRQEVYYVLSFNLAAQKKFEEATEVAEYAIELEPRVPRAHYNLALILALSGKIEELIRALQQLEELSPNYEGLSWSEIENIAIFYQNLGMQDKIKSLPNKAN